MQHTLTKLAEFQAILEQYQISPASQEVLMKTPLVLLTAPTSSGRNTIMHELVKRGDYYYIVSDTTRQPRINDGVPEQDGVEYWFRTEEDMLADLQAGKFLEAALIHEQQVSGISIREMEKARASGRIAITDIEIAGTHTIVQAKPDTIVLFILPPDFEEWQRRIKHRGLMSDEEFRRRMESAVDEFTEALERPYYHFVVNDKLSDTIATIDHLAKSGVPDGQKESRGREICEKLLAETKKLLAQAT